MKSLFPASPLPNKARSRAAGFTLIELLVVIVVIAILVGMLLPVLAGIRRRAKTAACMSNLRQMGGLVQLYMMDHNNFFPPATTNNQGYVVTLAQYLPTTDAKATNNVFVSPAAAFPNTTYDNMNFTYAVHNGLFGGSEQSPVSVTAVTRPAEIIMIANGAQIPEYGYSCAFTFYNPWQLNQGDGHYAATMLDTPIPYDPSTNVDNDNGMGYLRYVQENNTAVNVLMVDGHAETIPIGKVLYRNVVYDQ